MHLKYLANCCNHRHFVNSLKVALLQHLTSVPHRIQHDHLIRFAIQGRPYNTSYRKHSTKSWKKEKNGTKAICCIFCNIITANILDDQLISVSCFSNHGSVVKHFIDQWRVRVMEIRRGFNPFSFNGSSRNLLLV